MHHKKKFIQLSFSFCLFFKKMGKNPKNLKDTNFVFPTKKTKSLFETNPARNPLKMSQKSRH